MPLTTSLTRSALRANSAGAGADHFVAPAMRASDVHEHVAERLGNAFCVGTTIGSDGRTSFVGRVIRNDVD